MNCIVTITCYCGEVLREVFNGDLYNEHDHKCGSCGKVYDISRPRIEENVKKTNGTFSAYWAKNRTQIMDDYFNGVTGEQLAQDIETAFGKEAVE